METKNAIFNVNKFRLDLTTERVVKRRLNLRDAAEEIGIVAATLSRLEKDATPDVDTMLKVCKWLNVPSDRYFNKK